jgi:HSP20 family protein
MFNNDTYYSEHACIYPGTYEPMPGKDKEMQEQLSKRGIIIDKAPVNISEQTNHYKIEIAAPGFTREDFIIDTSDRFLSVFAMKKKLVLSEDPKYSAHGFTCNYIKREVKLPGDIDSEFGTAEYRNGILCIYLYKSIYHITNRQGHIYVY